MAAGLVPYKMSDPDPTGVIGRGMVKYDEFIDDCNKRIQVGSLNEFGKSSWIADIVWKNLTMYRYS